MDFISNIFEQAGSELIAVIVGGVLATIGGFLANVYEDRRAQRRQGLHLRHVLLDALRTVQALNEGVLAHEQFFFDPGWYRAMGSLRTEYHIYERNREQMVYLNDPRLRTDIANFMIRLLLVADGFMDDRAIFERLEDEREVAAIAGDKAALERIAAREAQQKTFRANRQNQLDDIIATLPDLTKRLKTGLPK